MKGGLGAVSLAGCWAGRKPPEGASLPLSLEGRLCPEFIKELGSTNHTQGCPKEKSWRWTSEASHQSTTGQDVNSQSLPVFLTGKEASVMVTMASSRNSGCRLWEPKLKRDSKNPQQSLSVWVSQHSHPLLSRDFIGFSLLPMCVAGDVHDF